MDFLYRVYASTREEELAVVPWDADQKTQFLRMQFTAQHRHYQQYYADASFEIILLDEQPIGRLYVQRDGDEIRLIDIALLPAHRGNGIGRMIIEGLLKEATEAGNPVRLHVNQQNPALRLYHRLGFTKIGNTGVDFLMGWSPEPSHKTS